MAGRSYCRLIEGGLFVKPFNWPAFQAPRPRSINIYLIDNVPYSDPQFAAISIKTSVSVKVLFANYIEMNQVKM